MADLADGAERAGSQPQQSQGQVQELHSIPYAREALRACELDRDRGRPLRFRKGN